MVNGYCINTISIAFSWEILSLDYNLTSGNAQEQTTIFLSQFGHTYKLREEAVLSLREKTNKPSW